MVSKKTGQKAKVVAIISVEPKKVVIKSGLLLDKFVDSETLIFILVA